MFVPYGDPGPIHYRKLVLDEGEYGIGLLTNSLELGCDCLGEIAYLDGVVNDNDGQPIILPNAICLHEEDHGIAWKHTDFRTGYVEVRRMRRMVISSHRHRRQLRVRLLLVPVPGRHDRVRGQAVRRDLQRRRRRRRERPSTARSSPPASTARTTSTSSTSGWTWRSTAPPTGSTRSPRPPTRQGPDNPVGNAWRAQEVLIADETMARREADPLAGRYWKIVNENVRNSLGQPVAYKLMPNHVIRPFAHPGSAVARRAPFMFSPLWVTAYDKDELFATGDYPNQAAGGAGLPAFAARERNLTDTDVVLWFTFGTNHVVRPEDWPVMPVHPIGFKLLPAGFFVGNPALDNPQPGGDHCHHSTTRTCEAMAHTKTITIKLEERSMATAQTDLAVDSGITLQKRVLSTPGGTRPVGGQHGPERGDGAAPAFRLPRRGQRRLAVVRHQHRRLADRRVLRGPVRHQDQLGRLVLRLGDQGARPRRGQRRGLGPGPRLPVHRDRLRDRLRDLRRQPPGRVRPVAGQPRRPRASSTSWAASPRPSWRCRTSRSRSGWRSSSSPSR